MSAREAVVINAGNHYDINKVDNLKRDTARISQLSKSSKVNVFFLQTTPEEWSTSNGMFAPSFMFRTPCAVVSSPKVMAGVGHVSQNNLDAANDTGEIETFHIGHATYEHFGSIYPHMFKNESLLPRYRQPSCIPYCLPPDWRSSIALPILLEEEESEYELVGSSRNNGRIQIVPTWNQLLSRGTNNSRNVFGDCTHKSADTLIEMNKQLLRTMYQSQQHK